jgi:hypothetical protein
MKVLFFNRFVRAFVKTVSVFGIVHLLILAIIATRGNIHVLNAFNIISLDAFIPVLGTGMGYFILSYGMVLVVYCSVYLVLTKPAFKQ